jgi:hypothetical protein
VPKSPWFLGESRGIAKRHPHPRTRPFAGNIRAEQETHHLLAMQKVEGSNPFNRFTKDLHLQVFFL